MNKLSFVLFFSAFTLILNGQTTLEEFTYLTKGYKLDLDTGRDIKDGYEIEHQYSYSSSINVGGEKINRKVEVMTFKESETGNIAATLAILERPETGYKKYFCIPSKFSDSEILIRAKKHFFDELAEGKDAEAVVAYHYLWNSLSMVSEKLIGREPRFERD